MEIKTKFSLGDSVYYYETYNKKLSKTVCPKCNGTGKLTLIGGEDIQCVFCHGSCGEHDYINLLRAVCSPSEVGSIRIEMCNNPEKNEVYYMLQSTGIGSGTLHKEEGLFRTYKECDIYCNEKNINLLLNYR